MRQPPTSSYNFQRPHGRHCHHGRHGHGGRGEHDTTRHDTADIEVTFKLDFQGNLNLSAFAILVIFFFLLAVKVIFLFLLWIAFLKYHLRKTIICEGKVQSIFPCLIN